MEPVRYLVGAEAALSELLTRQDQIFTTLTALEESMESIEERAAAVVQYLGADRRALVAKMELLRADLEAALANDAADADMKAELQAKFDAAAEERDQLKLALDADAAQELVLADVLAPFEEEMMPAPAPDLSGGTGVMMPTPESEPTPEPAPEA